MFVIVAGFTVLGGGDDRKTVTAYFPRTVSLYEGSDVRVLGIAVGTVDKVEPEGTQVKVLMSYESDVDIPSTAKAVIISPAIVGDRYVQLTPPYRTARRSPTARCSSRPTPRCRSSSTRSSAASTT